MARNPGIPHYRKIADAILASFKGNPGQKLPSHRALARRFNVATATATRALKELKRQGYVSALPGSGTFSKTASPRIVYGFGYLLYQAHFTRFFNCLGHCLGEAGFHLIVRDLGLKGEFLSENFSLDEVARSEAVVWYVPGLPEGTKAFTAARRRLPPRLPLVLVDDNLGLSLQGNHRFDLVHMDSSVAMRTVISKLATRGCDHPVLIKRSDFHLFCDQEASAGFLVGLTEQGIAGAENHLFHWDIEDRQSLRKLFTARRNWRPSAIILEFPYDDWFQEQLVRSGVTLEREVEIYCIGKDYPEFRLAVDLRDLAEVCAELVVSRLNKPNRRNLRVGVNIPVLPARRAAKPGSNV